MSPKQKRFASIAVIALLLGGAVALILGALRDNIVFFYTPSEITTIKSGSQIRLGGLVKAGSVVIDGINSEFVVTDGEADITVRTSVALPNLFREGQGIVAEGQIDGRILTASNVLAKHDETYMPKEIAESLKDKGVWQGNGE